MRVIRWGLVAALAMAMVGSARRAAAQSNDETFPSLQWNFSTPGARANAMGRAFIGLADDASAAITNPAGLLSLTRPQVYFEFKATDIRVKRLAAADSLFTIDPTVFSKMVAFPSFVNVSMPIGNRLAVGFTRHEFLNYQEDFSLAPRPVPSATQVFVLFPVEGTSRFTGVSYAGSLAFRATDALRLGVTIAANHLSADATATRFGFVPNSTNAFASTKSTIVNNESSVTGETNKISATFGALYAPNDKLSVGLQFATGPKFSVAEDDQNNPGFFNSPQSNLSTVEVPGFPLTVQIHVPTRIGAGVAYRVDKKLLVAADVVRIGYSSLANNFTIVFPGDGVAASDFSIKDAVETHVGAEYLLASRPGRSIFVRAGVYTNPDHTVRYNGANTTQQALNNSLPRSTGVAGTMGVGFVFGRRLQADFAYVTTREFVASVGGRF